MKSMYLFAMCLLSLSLFAACGESEHDDHDDHDELSAEQEACTHAQDSPTTVQAGVGLSGLDVSVDEEHTLYEVTLNETEAGSGEYEGYVIYNAAEHADYLIFTSSEIDVTVLDSADAEVETTSAAVESCEELAESHRVSLEAESYVINLGPSSQQTVSLIIESDAHDHEHE